jgi:acetyl-CoA acetyltransferase
VVLGCANQAGDDNRSATMCIGVGQGIAIALERV